MSFALQADSPPLVLASQSPARRELLARVGLRFEAMPARVDEAALKEGARAEGLTAEDAALILADAKAARLSARRPEAVVLGADQILVCEGAWFDKPEDMEGARDHLRRLCGKPHELVTAVVAWQANRRLWHHVAVPRLVMRAFSDDALEAILALEGDEILGSVGAYRFEGPGAHLFSRAEGEHAAILGLPLLPLMGWLRDFGVLLR